MRTRYLIIAAMLVAGCGSDAEIRVTETDFAIAPPVAAVEPGALRLVVANEGEARHALSIEGVDDATTGELAAGETAELEVDLDAGTYTWFCPVGDHRERGMEGELVVGNRGSTATATPDSPSYGY